MGRINRGYESFTQECFEALKNSDEFNLFLIKGGGKKTSNEIVLFNLHRNSSTGKLLAGLLKTNAYFIEQLSFLLSLVPLIIKKKPSLIYYSDFTIGSYLWHLRKRLKFSYKLLFANGAPNGPPYKTEDHVQQLLPVFYSIGVKSDGNKTKHTLLPYAFNIDAEKRKNVISNKHLIRQQLGFSASQKIVLSVGTINKQHKRMDYIVNEIALLSNDYFLIILGQYDNETDDIIKLAENKLKGRYLIKNVLHKEMDDYYIASDYFVLASLQEGFGRVTIEALSFGLSCIVHDYIVNHQVLREQGFYVDMRFKGELSNCLQTMNNNHCKNELIQAAYDNYSWDALKSKYVSMISKQLNQAN